MARTGRIALALMLLTGCGGARQGLPAPSAPDRTAPRTEGPAQLVLRSDGPARPGHDRRFRFIDQAESGMHSILLVPTSVEDHVAIGPLSRARLFVGALFATRRVGRYRVDGVGFVVRSAGGGLGATLTVAPTVVITVDGADVWQGSLTGVGIYSAERTPWGGIESLTFRVPPETLSTVAAGSEVWLRIGHVARLKLSAHQIGDVMTFLSRIPEEAEFEPRPELVDVLASRGLR